MYQDSDWEEVQAGDAEMDQDLLHSLSATSSGRPTYEHLEAMEKVFNKVWKEHVSTNLWVHLFFFSFFAIPFPYFWLNLLEHFKDHEDDYEADQLCVADPLNQVLSGCQIFVFPRMAVVKNFLYC